MRSVKIRENVLGERRVKIVRDDEFTSAQAKRTRSRYNRLRRAQLSDWATVNSNDDGLPILNLFQVRSQIGSHFISLDNDHRRRLRVVEVRSSGTPPSILSTCSAGSRRQAGSISNGVLIFQKPLVNRVSALDLQPFSFSPCNGAFIFQEIPTSSGV